jgi:hypothetical protein
MIIRDPFEGGILPHFAMLCSAEGDDAGNGDDTVSDGAGGPSGEPVGDVDDAGESKVVARPDYVPEKFWDADAGTLRVEDVFKSYKHLEDAKNNNWEGVKKEVEAEVSQKAQNDRLAHRPDSAEKYETSFDPKIVPDGMEFSVDEDNPLMQFWRKHSFDNGYSQDQFSDGLTQYIQQAITAMPDPGAEVAKLGENYQARSDALGSWSRANLDPDSAEAMDGLITTAKGFELMEKLMGKAGEPAFAGEGSGKSVSGAKSITELRALMNDPRYHTAGQRDAAYVAMVDAEFAKSYPGEVPIAASGPSYALRQ